VILDRSSASHGFTLRQRKEKSNTEIGVKILRFVLRRETELSIVVFLSELLMRFMLHHCFLWRKAYNNFDRMQHFRSERTVPQVDTAVSYSCPKVQFTMICRICSKDFNSVNSYIKHIQCIFNPQRGSKF
jgi:hypothetical protein